jgi:hypothetical protein
MMKEIGWVHTKEINSVEVEERVERNNQEKELYTHDNRWMRVCRMSYMCCWYEYVM